MLVLSRKLNQSIMIGDDVEIIIVSVDRDQVKLGIKAPREIAVHRSEVYQEIQRANESAVSSVLETPEGGSANPAVLRAAPPAKPVKKASGSITCVVCAQAPAEAGRQTCEACAEKQP